MKSHGDDMYLFEQLKLGHKAALQLLFDKYYEPLCNFAYLFLKNTKITEEIVDDVFIHIWEQREKLSVNSNPRAYLYRSTKNGIISYLRKNKMDTVSLDVFQYRKMISQLTPETLLINKEIRAKLEDIISQLSAQAGLVFRLHKMDDMKYKEIAEVLDISVKTVENHMGRALKIFRKIYEENANFFGDE